MKAKQMTAEDVIELLAALDTRAIDYWVDGGWGIDALVGRQTRAHADLDLGVRLEDVARIEAVLPGFRRRSEEEWPGFLLLEDDRSRIVDLLLVDEADDGQFWQQLAGGRRVRRAATETRASGHIGGRLVRCASVALQREQRERPDATEQDRADLEMLEREASARRPC